MSAGASLGERRLHEPPPLRARPFERRLLRHEIRHELLVSLLAGRLSAGEHVTEAELARRLGVSRTPLREALFGLERDGFFRKGNGKGLLVSPLMREELRELYPILSALEGLVAHSVRPGPRDRLHDLTSLAARIAAVARARPGQAFALEAEWTGNLLSRVDNEELRREASRYRDRTLRYERAFGRAVGAVPWDAKLPREVASSLVRRDSDGAARGLESFRRGSAARLTAWIERLEEKDA